MNRALLTAFLMALVTYLPRMIPLVFLGDRKLPPFWENLLRYVPYAVLGALIFPETLMSTGRLSSSLAGTATALVLAWCGRGLIQVVFGAIAVTLALELLF